MDPIWEPIGFIDIGCIGDEILPSCVGIVVNHYEDPYLKNQYNGN